MTNPGFWTDVILLSDGGFLQVTTDGPLVRGFVRGVEMWRIDAPEALMFCRAALWKGQPISIHQGNQSGLAWLVTPSFVRSLGVTFGVQPVAIDSTDAYIVRSSTVYERIRLDDFSAEQFPNTECPGSSQGWSDLRDGVLYWADLHRSVVLGGLTLTYPNTRGAVTVGQADPAQIAGWNSPALFTAFQGDGFEPHLAFNGAAYAIVARTAAGAAYLEVPPYPPFVGAGVPPEPPEPGPEPPEPEPGPEPPDPTPVPPQPIPAPPRPFPRALPLGALMDPIAAAFKMGSYFARVDPTPNQAPWPGWFLVHFDQLDPSDPHCQFALSQPEAGNPRLKLTNRAIVGILSADAGIHGGGVCKQYYLKPGTDDWGWNEQFNGWTLGPGGPQVVLVQYQNGECSASVQVVAL